ncbi:DUF1304 domain-containing protein [Oculatella sp. FACHB-28]|uniref:DUF1304 domain-containing protein n=1 Tax=Oculatella sp. FACHB-28 TaxID=2692845 RepID=UPI00168300EF|nr:DUF1304 domain-containing protein [Oculatella sp. FACHB-28]MBD2056978.1 DUF1304 domain-containing protein [Oculatella sp. FACHB-28]
MKTLSTLLVGIVALLHIGFFTLEMFLWKTPFVRNLFDLTQEQANFTAPLAANMGLYNSFLAVGLLWGLLARREGFAIKVFLLACAIIAGIYGAATVRPSILVTQALPAAVALLLVWLVHRSDTGSQTGPDVSR